MRNPVFDSSLFPEASWETRHFVPLLRKTGFYQACTADSCRSFSFTEDRLCHLKM